MSWRIDTGDCREHQADEPYAAIVTDPPYGYKIAGNTWDDQVAFDPATWASLLPHVKEGGYAIAFTASKLYHHVAHALEAGGFTLEDPVAWVFGTGTPKAKHKIKPSMELAAVARHGGKSAIRLNEGTRIGKTKRVATASNPLLSHRVYGSTYQDLDGPAFDPKVGRHPSNFTHDGTAYNWLPADAAPFFYHAKASVRDRLIGNLGHAEHDTVKPINLMRWLVRLVTDEGDTVLDPFAGSGTTGAACLLEGRSFVGIEQQPEYADAARAMLTEIEKPGR